MKLNRWVRSYGLIWARKSSRLNGQFSTLMTNAVKKLLSSIQAAQTLHRERHEDSLDHLALPGSTVYVLPDGRKNWMNGAAGVVVSNDSEWASIQFKDQTIRKFRLSRISRTKLGLDCAEAHINNQVIAFMRTL